MPAKAAHVLATITMVLACAGCDIVMGPTAPDGRWATVTTPRFTFQVRPGSFAEQHTGTFTEVLDDQFQATTHALALSYAGRITFYLHESGADAGFESDGNGGNRSGIAYPDTETVKAACTPPVDDYLFALLAHEANHVIITNGLGRPGTSFVNEGLASAVLSERFHQLGPQFYHRWARQRRTQLPRLTTLIDDDQWKTIMQPMSYGVSASFLAYLLHTHGPVPLKSIYSASSAQFLDRFRQAYGLTLEEAEARWLLFLDTAGDQ